MRTLRPREVKQPVTYLQALTLEGASSPKSPPGYSLSCSTSLRPGCTASVPHTPGPSSYCLSFHSPRSRAPVVIIHFVCTFLPLPVRQPCLDLHSWLGGGSSSGSWRITRISREQRGKGERSRKKEQTMQKHGRTKGRLASREPRSTWLKHRMNAGE